MAARRAQQSTTGYPLSRDKSLFPFMPARQAARRAALAALALRMQAGDGPAWREYALARTVVALVTDRRLQRAAADALIALGRPNTAWARWRFAWSWWLAGASNTALGLQVDRITPQWVRDRVTVDGTPPDSGAVLVTPHHSNQRIGLLCLASMVSELGVVARFAPADAPPLLHRPLPGPPLTEPDRLRRHSDLYRRAGIRFYAPTVAIRKSLIVLSRGGCLVILPDFGGTKLSCVLGRCIPVGPGAVWLAQKSDRPIIPYVLAPHGRGWRLWFGQSKAPTPQGLVQALEEGIRQCGAAWSYWPDWFAGRPCHPEQF